MKAHILCIAAILAASGTGLNLVAQETKNSSPNTELHTLQISDIKNQVVTVENLDIENKEQSKTEVRVFSEYGKYSEYGKSLYVKHRWKKENRKVAYDFSQFPDGKYTVELYRNRQLVASREVENKTPVQTGSHVAGLVTGEK